MGGKKSWTFQHPDGKMSWDFNDALEVKNKEIELTLSTYRR